MIICVTGQPGSGKTLKVVDMLANDSQWQGRPLFVMGIPELLIEHSVTPPVAEWTQMNPSPEDESLYKASFTFPPNSVVVIDEAQTVFRPRASGSRVPPEVMAFETHRHQGIDFILLTQHVGLLDSNIRKYVGKHIHIAVTPFGRFSYEWTKCADPESKSDRDIAARDRYILPKRSFHLYKSSEKHTKIKTKIPLYAYVFLIGLVVIAGLSYYIYGRIFHRGTNETVSKLNGAPGASTSPVVLTAKEYYERELPRVPGVYHTAPVYDDVTKPVEAPIPVGCLINHKSDSCRCIDQQGNDYVTTKAVCSGFVSHGMFIPFKKGSSSEKDPPDPVPKG